MKTTNKLVKFNIYFIITFFVILSVLTYFIFKNISYLQEDKLEESFTSKVNAAKVIYDNISYKIESNLNKFKNADNLANLIKEKKEDEVINFILKDIDSIIDMACIYTKDKVCIVKNESSQDVFDALQKVKRKFKDEFFIVKVKDKNYYMLRSNIKIIDKKLGKVIGVLCFSVVLNDNFLFIQELKDKLDVDELFLVSDDDVIVGSKILDEKLQNEIISLKEKKYIKTEEFVISKYKFDNKKQFSFVMFLENSERKVLNKRIMVLSMLVIVIIFIAFLILYLILRKYIKKVIEQEEIMIAQSRHAAMGEMISMIAHQWRQPLSVIAMGANNIIADIELNISDEKVLHDGAIEILDQTKELSKTIDDFKNFFRPIKTIEYIHPEDIFNEAYKVVGKSLENNNIEVIQEFKNSKKMKTYSRELMQVFINIIKNAKEALVEKEIKDKKIFIFIKDTKDFVEISVCDNAGGINLDIIDKIFNPYFSTKYEKSGTGLGLYMSKTIIEKHLNGILEVENSKDGACFKIKLPYDVR